MWEVTLFGESPGDLLRSRGPTQGYENEKRRACVSAYVTEIVRKSTNDASFNVK